MLIHDDGNSTDDTIYNNEEVVNSIRECVARGVIIQCLFNVNEDLTMVNELREHDKIEFHYLDSDPPDCDIHYKIIDFGRKLYLSRHCENDEREYEMLDCSEDLKAGRRLYRKFSRNFENGARKKAAFA